MLCKGDSSKDVCEQFTIDLPITAMDWHLLGLSFITVFLAELGDKSQLAAIALSGNSRSPKVVFFGAVSALILASLLGVLLGEGTAHLLPARWVKAIAALGFAIIAIRLLLPKQASTEQSEADTANS
jgi:putative Ca2+/H+ antiporter (TMEM165/GDT1 family)